MRHRLIICKDKGFTRIVKWFVAQHCPVNASPDINDLIMVYIRVNGGLRFYIKRSAFDNFSMETCKWFEQFADW